MAIYSLDAKDKSGVLVFLEKISRRTADHNPKKEGKDGVQRGKAREQTKLWRTEGRAKRQKKTNNYKTDPKQSRLTKFV